MSRGGALRFALWGALALGVMVVAALLYSYKRPIAVLEALSRRGLAGAGLVKVSREGPVGRLVYWKGGSGPVVVLIHGVNDQAGGWAKTVPALIANHTVIALDLPGHGESAPSSGPLSLASMVEATKGVMKGEAHHGATLVGNSMGAWIAYLVATDPSAVVTRIVAVNGGPLLGEPSDLSLTPKTRAEARKLMYALRDPSALPVADFVLDDLVRRVPTSQAARLSLAELGPLLLDGKLGDFRTPVHLVWGASDRLVPLAYAVRLKDAVPGTRLTELATCGHVPQVECPERFNDALNAALSSTEPRS